MFLLHLHHWYAASSSAYASPPLSIPSRTLLALGLRLRRPEDYYKNRTASMSNHKDADPSLKPQQGVSTLNQDPEKQVNKDKAYLTGKQTIEDREALIKMQLGDPPEKPLPGDCCGSGCVRCVWDVYFEELEVYNNRKAALEVASDVSIGTDKTST